MTIPKITPYTGGAANPDGSQTQTEFTQNMFDQLSYEANLSTELNNTVDGINDTATQVDTDATSAAQSAAAAEAAVSGLNYQGLWPDSGGIAEKGDTYQTQVSGTPTGQYFTALQNTTVDPVGDDVNWRTVVSFSSVSSPNLISNSSFDIPGSATNPPDATPRNYIAGDELFKGIFAAGALTGVTYIDGKLNGPGQLYTDVYKSEKQKESTANHIASIASSDGVPVESGASFVDNGDYWRVTFDMSDTFSVKFEWGTVATRHTVKSLFDIYGHPNMGIYDVRAFGAVSSTVIDSTNSIRAACGAINKAGGGMLSGGSGDSYLVSGTSVLTTSDVTLDFNGAEIVFDNDLIYDGIGEDGGNGTSYGGVFWFNSGNDSTTATDNVPDAPANVLKNLRIRNLKLRQIGDSLINIQACRGFRFRSCEDVEIESCTFDNLAGEDINGWFYEKDFRIHDNYFVDSRVLSISMMLQDSECYNNHFTRCNTPFELTATDVRVYGNIARGVTTGNFIKISDSSRGYKQDIEIFNNKIKGSFNSFFANEIIISGDRFNRVHSHDNEINCDITSGRVYNLLTADGSWTFSDTISDKGISNALGDCVFMRPATPESTLNGNYTICGMKKIVGWSSSGLSLLQDNMNQQKVAKISYFNNTFIIKDGVTDHPSQGAVAGSMASTLYRGSLFVDPALVLNYVISNNVFDNGSETIIDRSPDVTALIGSETTFIYRGATEKTMTRFYGKKGGVLEIVVPIDAPQDLTIQNNANIINTLGADLTVVKGQSVKYCFTDTGSKMFQMS